MQHHAFGNTGNNHVHLADRIWIVSLCQQLCAKPAVNTPGMWVLLYVSRSPLRCASATTLTLSVNASLAPLYVCNKLVYTKLVCVGGGRVSCGQQQQHVFRHIVFLAFSLVRRRAERHCGPPWVNSFSRKTPVREADGCHRLRDKRFLLYDLL
jgi:hypothetical protein